MKGGYIFLSIILLLLVISVLFSLNVMKKAQKRHLNPVLAKEALVTLNKDGFSPKEVTIKPGTAIRWKNLSGKPQTVNSDNYPTNQLHRELNFGIFANGSTVMYIFTKSGTYGYHNQLHHEQEGKIIVTN